MPTLFSAVTVKVYSTSFFKPVSVQVVVAHCWLNPPPTAFTVYPVIWSPLSLGAVQDSTTLWLRTESTSGVLGVSGRPLTTSEMFAVACRLPSRVLSSTVYSTFMVPEKSAAGVTMIRSPSIVARFRRCWVPRGQFQAAFPGTD